MSHFSKRFKFSITSLWRAMLFGICATLLLAALPARAQATIIVNTTSDELNADGDCSLREAVQAANTNTVVDACTAGNGVDTITFAPTLTTGGDATITLSIFDTGLDSTEFGPTALYISSDVKIQGPSGSNGIIIQRNSADTNKFRLVHVTSSGALTLENLTLKNGLAQGGNGGNSGLNQNRNNGGGAAGLGGAIYNQGTLIIRTSTLTGNSAVGGNGGNKITGAPLESTGGGGVGGDGSSTTGGGPNGGTANCAVTAGNGGGGGAKASTPTSSGPGCAGGFGGGGGGGRGGTTGSDGGVGGFGGGGGGASRNTTGVSTSSGGTSTFGGGTGGVNVHGGTGGGGLGAGGAIFNNAGTLTIINATLSANTALGGNGGNSDYFGDVNTGNGGNGHGGAVFNYNGSITLVNSTLSDNIVTAGAAGTEIGTGSAGTAGSASAGALYNHQSGGTATVTLHNTILANTTGGNDAVTNGTVNGTKSNIVESNSASFSAQVISNNGDPTLSALADNGGPTSTQAIAAGSRARDSGDAANCQAYDQRNYQRPLATSCDIGAFEFDGVVPPPEIDVQGNSVSIASGDSTPSSSDHTDFGSVNVSSGTVVRTFTIQNSGTAALTLSGTPSVALSGANAGDFTVTTQPASSVAASGSTTFQITFDPSAAGVRTATVTIANNDSDEGSYTFAIQGAGTAALTSTQLTQLSGYSQTCATATTPYVKQCTINFTLQNISGGTLQVKYYQLTTLSSHVDLLNGTPNPGGVGAQVTGPGSVAASATFQPSFTLGLKSNTAYTIRYKVYGYAGAVMAAGADDAQAIELGEYAVTLPADDATSSKIFLPLVAQ